MPLLPVSAGQRFGRWTVIAEERSAPTPAVPNGRRGARCECDCGTIRVITLINLYGRSRSCGCLRSEVTIATNKRLKSAQIRTHGLTHTYLYSTWRGMIRRCTQPGYGSYEYYGGRGIRVCDEWLDFTTFAKFLVERLGQRPDGYTLDRINNDGNYEPDNVRWADRKTQRANSRRVRK